MIESTTLAEEIAAEIELGLPVAAKRAKARLVALKDTGHRLKQLGLCRPLDVESLIPSNISMAGVSTANVTVPAFGGLLFGASTMAQGMRLSGADILATWEVARVKMGDIDFFGKDERLRWQLIQLTFDVLEALIEERRAEMILIDLPLFVSRREEAVISDDASIQEEWDRLAGRVNSFWEKHLPIIYPFHPDGVKIVSLRSHSATSLFSALRKNPQSSPDENGEGLAAYFNEQWDICQQLGQSRLLDQVLSSSSRSIAYSYEDLDVDPRWQPSALHQVGILGLFLRARRQTEVWHLQIPGHKTQWTNEALDRLTIDLVRATLYDDKYALPLPLWFAKKNVHFPKELLLAYRESIEKELMHHD